MKVGDLVVVVGPHHWRGEARYKMTGIIVESFGVSSRSSPPKAWRVLFEDGAVRSKMANNLKLLKNLENSIGGE